MPVKYENSRMNTLHYNQTIILIIFKKYLAVWKKGLPLHSNQKNWAIDDYVDGYIDMGKQNYSIYKIFRKEFNLPATQTIEILEGTTSSGNDKKGNPNLKNHVHNFKSGNLSVICIGSDFGHLLYD